MGVAANTLNSMGIHTITEQVEEIARSFLLGTALRDPRELSLGLADELIRLEVVDYQESAQTIDLSALISLLSRGLSVSRTLDVAISGDIPNFFLNKARTEALFYNLLRNCDLSGAKKVDIQCRYLSKHWEFSLSDDGDELSPSARSALLDRAYEVSEAGEIRMADLSLFIAKQIVRFYEGDISVSPRLDAGSIIVFSIPEE